MPDTGNRSRRKAGRPKDDRKREAILCAAGDCFLKAGVAGTNMDEIARAANVSKLTVYNHFRDKETLFKSVIAAKCLEFAPPDSLVGLENHEPRAALTRIGNDFMRLMVRPEVVAMHRVIPAEAASTPKIAQLFFEAGPKPMLDAFTVLLEAWIARGSLDITEPGRAADHFYSILKGVLLFKLVMNIDKPPPEAELKRHVADCVDMFVRAYAVRRKKALGS
ncbi:MAG: TetR/AcrR family transcriptional regulator [Betaproteobacteria bacterium]|jgi:TetR/AcrR family transcriptional repressor of mexJK operon|nr:TetR/AcrR family transcriptional regulator [Betaproteobacteria bacterium]